MAGIVLESNSACYTHTNVGTIYRRTRRKIVNFGINISTFQSGISLNGSRSRTGVGSCVSRDEERMQSNLHRFAVRVASPLRLNAIGDI